jgi:hypothetical protein
LTNIVPAYKDILKHVISEKGRKLADSQSIWRNSNGTWRLNLSDAAFTDLFTHGGVDVGCVAKGQGTARVEITPALGIPTGKGTQFSYVTGTPPTNELPTSCSGEENSVTSAMLGVAIGTNVATQLLNSSGLPQAYQSEYQNNYNQCMAARAALGDAVKRTLAEGGTSDSPNSSEEIASQVATEAKSNCSCETNDPKTGELNDDRRSRFRLRCRRRC